MIAACALGLYFLLTLLLVLFLIGGRRQDPIEPASAEAPDPMTPELDRDGDLIVPDPLAAIVQACGFDLSKPFTGEDTRTLIATGDGPAIVAGDDLKLSQLVGSIHAAYERYRRGLPIGGRRELSPLSTWTADGWVSDRRVP